MAEREEALAAAVAAPSRDINAMVGRTLREHRMVKGLTASDLARRAGLSAGMISRIESGQVSPSLSTLEVLASVLEAPLAGFFRDAGSAVSDFTHVRSGEGLKSVRLMGQHMHAFTALGIHHRQDISFEAILVTIERNEKASPPTYAGHGCVFVYVLEGAAIYRYGQREIRLSEGDSISLDAELRYGVQEVLTPRLRFLSVQAERR